MDQYMNKMLGGMERPIDWLTPRTSRPGLRHSLTGHGAVTSPVPEIHEIRVEDLAHSTAQIARFGGWLREQFSVAQHMLEVGALCRELVEQQQPSCDEPRPWLADEAELAGLVHDLREGFVGDQITPAKRLLGPAWSEYEGEVARRTHEALGVDALVWRHSAIVDWADAEMVVSDVVRWGVPGHYVSKRGDFVVGEDMRLPAGYELRYAGARVLTWREAREAYLTRYFHLRAVLALRGRLPPAAKRLPLPA